MATIDLPPGQAIELQPPPQRLIIEPTRGWRAINLLELWHYRELLYFLAWRDLKVRYKHTALGAMWAVIQPLFQMVIFSFLFGGLARLPSDNIPYPIFSFVALVPWTYFANMVGNAGNSLVGNAHLITKVYFPRLLVPLAVVVTRLVDYFITVAMLLVLMAVYWGLGRYSVLPLPSAFLTIPLLTLLVTAIGLGLSLWLSALNVQYRDVGHLVSLLMQVWMYATPVVWALSTLEEEYPQLLWLAVANPMTGVIEGFRSAFLNRPWNWPTLAVSLAAAPILLVSGAMYFRRVEKKFADII